MAISPFLYCVYSLNMNKEKHSNRKNLSAITKKKEEAISLLPLLLLSNSLSHLADFLTFLGAEILELWPNPFLFPAVIAFAARDFWIL